MNAGTLGLVEMALLFTGLLVVIALLAVDLHRRVLPDALNAVLGATGLGFHAAAGWRFLHWGEILAGAGLGAALLLGLRFLYLWLRGIEALGLGDVKFMLAAGCWVGLPGVPLVLTLASLGTLLAVLVLCVLGRLPRTGLARRRIAFGPGLGLALIVVCAALLSGLAPGGAG